MKETDDEPRTVTQHEEPKSSNVLGNVAGAVGSMAHGVVDVAEGLLRGIINVTTLGKSKWHDYQEE
jgi:hypothetical protein